MPVPRFDALLVTSIVMPCMGRAWLLQPALRAIEQAAAFRRDIHPAAAPCIRARDRAKFSEAWGQS
jgi:hypothetical protein